MATRRKRMWLWCPTCGQIFSPRAERPLHEPGTMTLARDINDWFCEELTAEHKISERRGRQVKQVWVRKSPTAMSHGLDVAVYATAAGHSIMAHRLKDPAARRKIKLSEVQREKRAERHIKDQRAKSKR